MTALIALTLLATPFAIKAASNWSHNPERIRRLNARAAIKAWEKAVAEKHERRWGA